MRTTGHVWISVRSRKPSAAPSAIAARDRHSWNDETAAHVVAAGGGMQAVIAAAELRTRENVLGLIDPTILAHALDNDALAQAQPPPL